MGQVIYTITDLMYRIHYRWHPIFRRHIYLPLGLLSYPLITSFALSRFSPDHFSKHQVILFHKKAAAEIEVCPLKVF